MLPLIKKYDALETVDLPPIEIFSTGQWNGDEYSLEDLQGMVDAFKEVGFHPPVKAGHAEGQEDEKQARIVFGAPALGYIKRIYLNGKKLLAEIGDVPRKFADLIKAGAYRRVSAEIFWQYKNEATGKVWPRVLKAVSFLGADIPALTNLKAIEALFNKNAQGLLYAKDGNDNEFRLYEQDYQQHVPFGPVTDFLLTSRRKAKADVAFTDMAALGSQCGGCKFYIENLNACTLVEGFIEADDGCKLFEADSENYSKSDDDIHSYNIVKRGGKFCLVAKSTGKTLGCHGTKEGAAKQEAAIKASQAGYEKEIVITYEQMHQICPPCAEQMKFDNIKALKLRSEDDGKTYAFPNMPGEKIKGLCDTFGEDEGFRTRCMDSGTAANVDDAGAFCNALKMECKKRGYLATDQSVRERTMRFTRDDIRELCPSCADQMESKGISALSFASVEAVKLFAFADMKECMADAGMMKENPDMDDRKKACQGMMDKKMSAIQEKIDTYQKGGADMTKEELDQEREKIKKEVMAELTPEFEKKIAEAKAEGAKDAETRYAKSIEDQGAQIEKMKAEKRASAIDNWIDLQKREGKIAAVEGPRMKAFLLSLEDGRTLTYSQDGKEQSLSQSELFKDIVGKRPSLFKVLSKAGDPKAGETLTYANAQEEVTAKVTAYQEEHKEKDYGKAMLAVLKADPDLNERYMRLQQ